MVDGWKSFLKFSDAITFCRAPLIVCLYVFYVTKKGIANTLFVEKNKIKFWLSSVSRMVLRQ